MRLQPAFRVCAHLAVGMTLLSATLAHAAPEADFSIAHVIPLSGVSGAAGVGYSLGAPILFDHVNARGDVVHDALERASEPTPEGVKRALTAMKCVDIGGFVVDFSTPGQAGSRSVEYVMIGQDGSIVR